MRDTGCGILDAGFGLRWLESQRQLWLLALNYTIELIYDRARGSAYDGFEQQSSDSLSYFRIPNSDFKLLSSVCCSLSSVFCPLSSDF